ncbi:MAG: aminomethyltransferase family protein [Verrucomicrobiales bacterium]|nr:aminomethyltransferase family protein [Verrucomicrobiales bacterium]
MNPLMLHEFHHSLGARFAELNGAQAVNDYGDWLGEHAALRETAGVIDLSFRSRLCLVGADRARFLHGQVTNDVKKLRTGEGCYAAITTAKGKMESDLNIFALADELLLDFEPGLTGKISARLEKFIVADDVQIVDAAPHYGLLSVQGPKAADVIRALGLFEEIPTKPFASMKISDATLGEIYLMNQPRLDSSWWGETPSSPDLSETGSRGLSPHQKIEGFDLFVPINSLGAVADKLIAAAKAIGGRACGWQAFETARIEAGIPRFGADMDETNIPLECGIESRAVTYNKGCYIGQEVINRIHSVGHVNRELRGLRLADDLKSLPARGDKLFHAGKEVGYVTSAVKSPSLNANIALGYLRREANQIGNELVLRTAAGESPAKISCFLPHDSLKVCSRYGRWWCEKI